jgi:hypothetical protein
VGFAAKNRLPAISHNEDFIEGRWTHAIRAERHPHRLFRLTRMQRAPSPLSWHSLSIPSGQGLLRALRDWAGTSRVCPALCRSCGGSGWSCLGNFSQSSPAWLSWHTEETQLTGCCEASTGRSPGFRHAVSVIGDSESRRDRRRFLCDGSRASRGFSCSTALCRLSRTGRANRRPWGAEPPADNVGSWYVCGRRRFDLLWVDVVALYRRGATLWTRF